jgi:hypothetical protein
LIAALVVALLLPGLGAPPAPAAPAPAPPVTQLFAPTSIWNTALPGNAALAGTSRQLTKALVDQRNARGAWINTTTFSTPVYRVPAGQAGAPVWIDHPASSNKEKLQGELTAVPIPAGAKASPDSDSRMVVWQQSSDRQWEFWHMTYQATGLKPGWHAGWGAVIQHVSQSSGINPWPFGATASGLALMGGLITTDDVRSGSIDHALALGVPQATQGVIFAPANRSDGRYSGVNAIPEGTRFRLDPKLNLNALGLPPATLEIARAAQRYGMIVRDGSGSVSLYAEEPTSSNPYPAWFGGRSASQLMQRFPWNHLQALPPNPGDGTPVQRASEPKKKPKKHHPKRRHHKRHRHHKKHAKH